MVTGWMLPFALTVAVASVCPFPVEGLPTDLCERSRKRGRDIGIEKSSCAGISEAAPQGSVGARLTGPSLGHDAQNEHSGENNDGCYVFHGCLLSFSFWEKIIPGACSPSTGTGGSGRQKRPWFWYIFSQRGERVAHRRILCRNHESVESVELR